MDERHERGCIVGTAQSWAMTPWQDPGLYIMSLNDAYRMKGFVRADAWYDFHPLDRFFAVPEGTKHIHAHQIPPGYYVRPADHLDWLAKQQIPIWLHEDYQTQCPKAATWRHARPIPRGEIEAYFGRYFTSSPALMMAHAMLQGAKELHIYGIHLATQHEYIEQRPNFEFLCGRLLGTGKIMLTVKNGLRRYETQDGLLVLPEASPVLQSDFRYAVDIRPRTKLESVRWDAHRVAVKRERAVAQLKVAPWWQRKKPIQEELWRLEAWQADIQEQLERVDSAKQWAGS